MIKEISLTKIIVIHDDMDENYPLIVTLKANYGNDNVILFMHSNDGLKYVLDNLGQKMVILLDKNFKGRDDITGFEVFEKIREKTSLINIILISANSIADFSEMQLKTLINNDLFKLEKFTNDYTQIVNLINEAVLNVNLRIDAVIEDWIMRHPIDKREQVILKTKDGRSYTMNELLDSIRHQTQVGVDFEKNLLKLAIELFSRQKLKIDD